MMNKSWFYLEPTTFIFRDTVFCFLYNSESGQRVLFNRTEKLDLILDQLQDVNNLYCVDLDESYSDTDIIRFVNIVRDKYMGDVMVSSTPPICLPPVFKCHTDKPKEDVFYSDGTRVMTLVNSVTFFLNSECSYDCPHCSQYYKQFICCHKGKGELLLEDVLAKIKHCTSVSSVSLNFCGGNVFLYKKIDELLLFLVTNNLKSNFYFSYLNWTEKYAYRLSDNLFHFHVYIGFPVRQEELSFFLLCIKQQNLKERVHVIFIISSDDENELANKIISENDLFWYSVIPFYNGINLSFFEDNVYTDNTDIAETCPNKHDIFKKQKINICDFGHLSIVSCGDVYSNINYSPIGQIHEDLTQIVYRELQEGKSWKRIRNQKPCNDCIYQYMCPSPSNYELVIGKNNLCNVK